MSDSFIFVYNYSCARRSNGTAFLKTSKGIERIKNHEEYVKFTF